MAARIKIPAELFALAESSHFEGEIELGSFLAGPDEYRFDEPLLWSVDVSNTGSALLVMGNVEGEGKCDCSRCLGECAYGFNGQIEGYFLIEGEYGTGYDEDDEDAPGEDEFEVLPADHILDLEPLIVAALLVDAPQQPLCRDDCAGLCPQCGANLNDGPCGCEGGEEQPDKPNPFAVLANYKFES